MKCTGMVVFSALAMLLVGCVLGPPLQTVPQVDVARYMGRWYEIAKYPTSFEAGCYDVTAEYTLRDDGTVGVVNNCFDAQGELKDRIEGYAKVADPQMNAKLTVYFGLFGAPYWIIDLGPDYEYAVVGEPTRQFFWILSRTPTMAAGTYQQIVERMPEWGYDPARLQPTPQSSGPPTAER